MSCLYVLFVCVFLLNVTIPGLMGVKKGFTVVDQWKQLDFAYPTDAERQHAIQTGEFVPENGFPIDVDVSYGENDVTKIFVTVPRFVDGIPATLTTIKDAGSPLLTPYPSWDWHTNPTQCKHDRLVSVFRVQIDECRRLWVLDTGKIGDHQICPPQIIAFDPNTNKVLHRYEIPGDQILCTSILVTPVVDVRDSHGGCTDTFIYAADVTGFGLIVHDVQHNKSWRITNKLFFSTPQYGTFWIAGQTFDLMDGVLGMALSPYHPGEDRILYFHSLASNTENRVHTSVLRNHTLFEFDSGAVPRQFVTFPSKRSSQSAAEAIDKNGVMYFGLVSEIAIVCWNINTEFDERNFHLVDGNVQTLQFATGVKIVNNRKGNQELWVLTDRLQKYMTGTFNFNDTNFRILAGSTQELLKGTKCNSPRNSYGGGYGFH